MHFTDALFIPLPSSYIAHTLDIVRNIYKKNGDVLSAIMMIRVHCCNTP